MPKTEPIPCTREEIEKIIEASAKNDFYYMLFLTAKKTGRRLGELYGSQRKKEIARKIIGKKIEYDEKGNQVPLAKTRAIYKRVPGEWDGGVKVKDIDLEKGLMKVWVLKRRKPAQDETILDKDVVMVIRHYILSKKLKPDDYLFREKSYRAIQEAVSQFAKKGGVPHKVCFHNFRHYFVTELKRKGWSNDEISKLTGHKTPSTLTIYDHVVATDLKDKALEDLKDI